MCIISFKRSFAAYGNKKIQTKVREKYEYVENRVSFTQPSLRFINVDSTVHNATVKTTALFNN